MRFCVSLRTIRALASFRSTRRRSPGCTPPPNPTRPGCRAGARSCAIIGTPLAVSLPKHRQKEGTMDWNTDLYARCAELRQHSASLKDAGAALRNEYAHIKEQAQVPAIGGAVYDAPPTPHELAMEALHLIYAMLNDFPIAWQMHIVKALTAIVLLKAREQTRPAQAVISA